MIDINWNPSRKELRVFALLLVIFFGIVARVIHEKTGSATAAWWVFGIAAVTGIAGFCLPKHLRIVYVVWMAAVMPIGWVVSHVVLGVAFFLVITPIGLMMRLIGYDPLKRRFDRNAKTYWIPREPQQGTRRYFRQF